jgi:hypothetical protein
MVRQRVTGGDQVSTYRLCRTGRPRPVPINSIVIRESNVDLLGLEPTQPVWTGSG